jgi:general secretion pathway protein L
MPRVLGLDLGSHSLKGVLLETTGRGTSVLRYAETRRADEAPLDEALAVFLPRTPWAGPGGGGAAGPSLATHVFTLPFTDPKRIAATLPFEVEGELPFELSQVVFDHQVTAGGRTPPISSSGWCGARSWPSCLKTLAARVGLDPRRGDRTQRSPTRTSSSPAPERSRWPRRALAVLDLGHRRTSVAVGRPRRGLLFARDLPPAGAVPLTAPGRPSSGAVVRAARRWEGARRLPPFPRGARARRARAALLRAPRPAGAREARATLKGRVRAGAPSGGRLLLAGGTARLPGLVEHLGDRARPATPTLCCSRGRDAIVPPEAQPPSRPGLRAGAPGNHVHRRAPRFNLRQGEFAFRGHVDYLRERLIRVAAFAGVLALLLCVFNVTRAILLGRREAAVDARLCALTQRVLGSCEKNYDRALNSSGASRARRRRAERLTTRLLAEVAQRVPPDVTVTFGRWCSTWTGSSSGARPTPPAASTSSPRRLKSYRCFREVKEGKVERAQDSSRVPFTLDVEVDCGDAVASAGSGS